ncbi:CDP-glycerol glycerophosphotransferase family protein [Shinella pollutisoli]|uniref:CDP-glycerol glycerophosphotransferase family protein n=1 Tax=Shinella pollutisoli TaxID=2250594 RepID=A0ABV7DJB9_9HYPH|nr:CDP-glycerol glycerophosphotransferase family protein [Shinella pollutisoli]
MPAKPCFVVKNKFQIAQFENLARAYPDARYLLLRRRTLWKEFKRSEIRASEIPIKLVDGDNVARIAAGSDVVFFQTLFSGIERVKRPLVSVQYGLAKERHNYGEWRALADMNLMFGPYSADRVAHFSPSYGVGNIKFADWEPHRAAEGRAEAKRAIGADPGKPLVLYMPTYGALGSFGELIDSLARLAGEFEVVIKMHHNNEIKGRSWRGEAKKRGLTQLYSGGADQKSLLAAADVVVSDFSGAIFDAIYARVPVVLFQDDAARRVGVQKFDLSSIEFSRRSELGVVCERPGELAAAIRTALSRPPEAIAQVEAVRAQLFADAAGSVARSTELVDRLLQGDIPRLTSPQLYVREAVRALTVSRAMRRQAEVPTFCQRFEAAVMKPILRIYSAVTGRGDEDD